MNATTMKDIEKVYCNSYNHDVKAPVLYSDAYSHLYADTELTKPVDSRLLRELFYAGVVVVRNNGDFYDGEYKPFWFGMAAGGDMGPCLIGAMMDGSNCRIIGFVGYDIEADTWSPFGG